jgi:hypothetical protein
MSDFLKKAAGLIFNIDEAEEQQGTPKNLVNTGAAVSYAAPAASSVTPDGAVTEKFRTYFKNLYDQANNPGPDFYEYHNMVEAMGNLIADEIKYPSVFAGFGDQLTKEKLLASGGQYLSMLETDRSDFEKSLVSAKQRKVVASKELAQKKAEEIKALQDKIATLNQDIIQLNKQAGEDEARLAAEQAAYYQQSDSFMQRIRNGIDKINQYLK